MRISVIIPAYNEESIITSTIRTVKKQAYQPEHIEIIVADGGSTDGTVDKAHNENITVIRAPQKRRSIQMNAGAQAASHSLLYFLHADTQPPRHFDRHILQSYRKGYRAGCFQLSFDSSSRLLAFYGWCTRFDVDAFRFGDQSLFVEKEMFKSTGGFNREYLLMEGHEMILRLKKAARFTIMNKKVVTSARAYRSNGTLLLQLKFTIIFILNKAGLAQAKLLKLHKKWVQ